MRISLDPARLVTVGGVLLAGTVLVADGTRFSDFTALLNWPAQPPTRVRRSPSAIADFQQESIVDRATQLADGKPNSGNFDMNTLNETGHDKGRYLFTVFETDQSGVQRHDLVTGETETIWQSRSNLTTSVRCVLLDALGNTDHGGGIVVRPW